MDKEDVRNLLKQTEKVVKDVGAKAGELAKALEKDAAYGTKAGILKIEKLALENEKNKLLAGMGKKAYELIKKKTLSADKLQDQVKKLAAIDQKISVKKASLTKLKKTRKKK